MGAILTAAALRMTHASATQVDKRFSKANGLRIGVQLYTLGPELTTTLEPSLEELAKTGFETVELAGYLGRSPKELRIAFDREGLHCPSAHIGPRPQGPDPDLSTRLNEVIEDAHTLGLEYVVTPIFLIPDRYATGPAAGEALSDYMRRVARGMTSDDWKRNAQFLNTTGEVLRRNGLKFAYHNHNAEFAPVDGTTGFETLLKLTDPDLVKFELDAGWAFAGGRDPAAMLRSTSRRFCMMHAKDVKPTTTTKKARANSARRDLSGGPPARAVPTGISDEGPVIGLERRSRAGQIGQRPPRKGRS